MGSVKTKRFSISILGRLVHSEFKKESFKDHARRIWGKVMTQGPNSNVKMSLVLGRCKEG